MVVPHGTVTVALEATVQAEPVTLVPPLSVMPDPPDCNAIMQAAAFGLTSAYEVAVTAMLVPLWNTSASDNGEWVVTVTSTAWLPSPLGDATRLPLAAPAARPFSAARLLTAEFIVIVEPLELYASAPA